MYKLTTRWRDLPIGSQIRIHNREGIFTKISRTRASSQNGYIDITNEYFGNFLYPVSIDTYSSDLSKQVDSMSLEEKVLCIDPCILGDELKSDHGWIPSYKLSLNRIIDTYKDKFYIVPRSIAEENEKFRHFITYTVINQEGFIYSYRRGKSGGENRLHDRISIGIGGHITEDDIPDEKLTYGSVVDSAWRELAEETNAVGKLRYRGCLCVTDENKVNRVHLGLVFELSMVRAAVVSAKEDCLRDFKLDNFFSLSSMKDGILEKWSKVLVDNAMTDSMHSSF